MADKSINEGIKDNSSYLRGNIKESLKDEVFGNVSEDDSQLTKFHGTYMQDDRDLRANRRKKFLDKAYSFMIRVRVPGGLCTTEQWLKMDWISDNFTTGTIKLTTRQAFQFHGVIKNNLKRTMQEINKSLLDTLAACGDVNRNVMCNPNPYQSKHHPEIQQLAQDISDHLTPRTSSYYEIWLEDELVEGGEAKAVITTPAINKQKTDGEDVEPIYGKHYLPRKFKTVIAVPPSNDVDIFAHCLGYIAIIEDDKIVGYNVTVGGGMGMTHGDETTYPRTAQIMGFCTPEQAVDVAEKVALVQRDFGNRENRKRARLKYTVEEMGLPKFREEVEKRLGYTLEEAKPYEFEDRGDRYGWTKGTDNKWHCGLFISNGRLAGKKKEGLREIAKIHKGDFRLTNNQNVIIGSVSDEDRPQIEKLMHEYGLDDYEQSGLRRNSMACVALPTCGLALAESERYLPDLITDLEVELEKLGLSDDEIVMRMTGCPNGCSRPYLAEIGFVGKNPGKYNLYLGAAFNGSRLNKLYKEDVEDKEIVKTLTPLFQDYANNRTQGERFGDFVIRQGYVAETTDGTDFHKNLAI